MREVRGNTEDHRPGTVGHLRAMGVRGWTLVSVLAIVLGVLLIGIAIFILGHSEGDVVEYGVDDSRAFYIAEAGLERARAWLGDFHTDNPEGDPVGKIFEDQLLGGGTYTVEVVEDVSGGGWLGAYRVVSTGEIDNVVRQVRAVMLAETFARYQVFIERGGFTWFRTGERFEGPVHVNHALQIDGDPWFGGPVTVGGGLTLKSGSNPTFVQGYQLDVPNIDLPPDSYALDRIKPAAEAGGLVLPALGGHDKYYEIVFDHYGPGVMGWRSWSDGVSSDWQPVPISGLNGAVYSRESIRISGVLDGQLTIGADEDVVVVDDILYQCSPPGGGPGPECDDVLGVITDGDVVIEYNSANATDCVIQAVMMSLEKNIEAEEYQHHPPRGEISIYGGIIADYAIHLAEFDGDGNLVSGYVRDYHWDARMITMPPPFFPLTGRYFIYSWEEVVPPED
ncbi:MAG: DUF4900 domain-containing protein [Candidatus Eisenbacteria bacterium]|nr:DUF4900 domain-containing protein [Candidatus Eisenbacteria bacterium]